MANSSIVNIGDTATASQYNNLRKDDLENLLKYYADSGAADAFVITADAQYTAYAAGNKFTILAGNTLTGASTLNVNAIGAVALKKFGSLDTEAGDINSGDIFEVVYDGTFFQIQGGIIQDHNDLDGLQGGTVGQYYHLTSAELTDLGTLSGGGNADALHSHAHNSTTSLQGGTSGQYYHLTSAQESDLTGGGNADTQHTHDLPPIGVMFQWLTDTAPTNYLLCYGQAVSRTTYATLFALIGVVYGIGDGSTTFNLPDMRGRFPLGQDDMGGSSANRVTNAQADSLGGSEGAEDHTLTISEIPSHDHDAKGCNGSGGSVTATYVSYGNTGNFISDYTATKTTGGGGAHNNMSPYLTVNYIIKAL